MSTDPSTEATTAEPLELLHRLARQAYIPQSKVVDLLLDLYAGAATSGQRAEIVTALSTLGGRHLVAREELAAHVALIGVAAEVESAFDHLLLTR